MRKILAILAWIAAVSPHWWWEFVRSAAVYDPLSHMLKEHVAGISLDTLVQAGVSLALAALGTWLLWPSRPDFLRRDSPLTLTLPRDSGSSLVGIQTFNGINYIQVQVSSSRQAENCEASILKSEFDNGAGNFAIEYNERITCPWSKRPEKTISITPTQGPERVTVLVYTSAGLHGETGTPTNWLPRLQRIGVHRLTMQVVGKSGRTEFCHPFVLLIDWRGYQKGAFVRWG